MDIVDLILLRILLTGLTIFFILGLFLLLRRIFPRAFSARLRHLIWLALLLLSLLIVPLPAVVDITESAPPWVFNWRLPAPDQFILDNQFIIDYFLLDAANYASAKIAREAAIMLSSRMADLGLMPQLTLAEILINLMPLLRIIYLSGFVLTLALQAFRRLSQKRKRRTGQPLDPENCEAWNCEIASLRDESGNYRQASVIAVEPQDEYPYNRLRNWRLRRIHVPVGNPAEISETDRRAWLALHLDQNARPDLLVFMLWLIVKSLFWFNPLWWAGWKALTDDLDMNRQKRLNKRLAIYPAEKFNIFKLLTGSMAYLLLIIAMTFLLWQMPQRLQPSDPAASAADLEIISSDILADFMQIQAYEYLIDENQLSYVIDDNFSESVLQLDSQGGIAWQQSLYELADVASYYSIELLDYCQIDENHWTLAIAVDDKTSVSRWLVQADANGQVLSRQLLALPDIGPDDKLVLALTEDGGWICLITNSRKRSTMYGEVLHSESDGLKSLARYDQFGQIIWTINSENAKPGFEIGQISLPGDKVVSSKAIGQILPLADGGCYLLLHDNLILTRRNRITDMTDITNIIRPDQVARISGDGQLLWLQTISGLDGQFYVLQAALGPDDTLVLAGQQGDFYAYFYQDDITAIEPVVLAITSDGKIVWYHHFRQHPSAIVQDILIQSDCMTVLLSNPVSEGGSYTMTISQLDLTGQPNGEHKLDLAGQSSRFIFVDKGNLIFYRDDF